MSLPHRQRQRAKACPSNASALGAPEVRLADAGGEEVPGAFRCGCSDQTEPVLVDVDVQDVGGIAGGLELALQRREVLIRKLGDVVAQAGLGL